MGNYLENSLGEHPVYTIILLSVCVCLERTHAMKKKSNKPNTPNEKKYRHLTYQDRCIIHQFLDYGDSFTTIAIRIHKDRTTVAKEVKLHRYIKPYGKSKEIRCSKLSKAPYVCNGCPDLGRCGKAKYVYDAAFADHEYRHTLSLQRSNLKITRDQVAAINDVVAPLMIHKNHSINQVYVSHPDILPFSKSTFYRYIDQGLLDVRNVDLQRKVQRRVKKEYDYSRDRIDHECRLGRQYHDFQDYMEMHPMASIVEMDTVIGTAGGKGGKCFLTLLFRAFNFMLIYLLPYKKVQYVNTVFNELKRLLGDFEFSRLFEVILTDNGTEFSDPESIELSRINGERLSNVFFCDPNASWQKGSIEKNHEYIRYVLPKGTPFSGLTQEDCTLLASHINSVPRKSLNNQSPYEAGQGFIGADNIAKLGIVQIPYDDIDLSGRLLRK